MPQLVQGHVRFTADDFKMQEFKDSALEHYKNYSFGNLRELLDDETKYLAIMKDPVVVQQFDTSQNVQNSLTRALALITALAEREGYDINALFNII
jgi:hypothetical protein